MGACKSLFSTKRQDEAKEREVEMAMLKEENRKLHNIISSLQLELHQQRTEAMAMTYVAKQERLRASSYKAHLWDLRLRRPVSHDEGGADQGAFLKKHRWFRHF